MLPYPFLLAKIPYLGRVGMVCRMQSYPPVEDPTHGRTSSYVTTTAQYIARAKSTVRRLNAVGETVSSTNLLSKQIGGLDNTFETLKISLSLIHDLDEDRLTQALMSEESRRALTETTVYEPGAH